MVHDNYKNRRVSYSPYFFCSESIGLNIDVTSIPKSCFKETCMFVTGLKFLES